VKVAVVGAGPAGSLLAWRLAGDGAAAVVFDASHPREKPCGGGLTAKALDLLPAAPASDPVPVRRVRACVFDSGDGESVDVALASPVAVGARREIDAWLLRRAVETGARHVAERVVEVDASGRVRTTAGREERFDLVVGADGAGSLVRRTFLQPTPPSRLSMAAGWYARGDSPMLVRFTPGLAGYLWLFPRPDHVGVGICAPLAATPTKDLVGRLEGEVARHFPALLEVEGGRYAHTIPSPSPDPASIHEIAGERWALVGDAAALADPITGEGIYYALRSAVVLADTLRDDRSPARYPARALEDFGHELLKAAALRERFFAPGFARRMIAFSRRSPAVREVLGDLVLGRQGYVGLKRRLIRAGPRFVWDWLWGLAA
jgi:geranylgeranyl diphosphate/geranylgeranyl-bacteriochlorophyllide a reductase